MQRNPFELGDPLPWLGQLGGPLRHYTPSARRRRRVTEAALVLLSVMQDLQVHRGLSGALIDRQTAFRDQREAIAERLSRSLAGVNEQFGARHPVFRSPAWQQVLERWASLHHHWRELDFPTCLDAHSELVVAITDIIGMLGDTSREDLGDERTQVMIEWPVMTEHLGMLRATGLHLIGDPASVADPTITDRLRYHLHEARSCLAAAASLLDGDDLPTATQRVIDAVVALRNEHPPSADAQGFYDITTDLIDRWYVAVRGRLGTVG